MNERKTNYNNLLARRGMAKLWIRSPNVPVWTYWSNGDEKRVHSSGALLWNNGKISCAHEYPEEWKLARKLEPKLSRAMMKLSEIISAK